MMAGPSEEIVKQARRITDAKTKLLRQAVEARVAAKGATEISPERSLQ